MEQVNEVVYVVKTEILTGDLQDLIDLLNKYELRGKDDKKLTLEEVLATPELLAYLCESLVLKEHDLEEAWSADAYIDYAQYRK